MLADLNQQVLSSEANALREHPVELTVKIQATNGTAILGGIEKICKLLRTFTFPKKNHKITGEFFRVTVLNVLNAGDKAMSMRVKRPSTASARCLADAVCMGCHRPLALVGRVAYWNPKTRQLVCEECQNEYRVIFLRTVGEEQPKL